MQRTAPRTVGKLADRLDRPAPFPHRAGIAARPGERLIFSRRELLLTSSMEHAAMPPGEQVRFGCQRWHMEMGMLNKGLCPSFEAVKEFQAEKAEAEGLSPIPAALPRRRRAPAPAV